MKNRKVIFLVLALLWGFTAFAQQQMPQPLTYWSGYAVRPGKEDEFMNLVKTVGEPVRDKQMAEGVVLGWGIEVPLLRSPGGWTHLIWYTVADWSGIEKVQSAIQAQLAKLAAEEAKATEEGRKKGQKPGTTTAERIREVFDSSKTRDWLTRDLVFVAGSAMLPAGLLPYTRYNFGKVKPGKAADFRAAWDKYNKPVLDKLVADGVILAYGLAVEELKTDGAWTHFIWYGVKSMDAFEKVRNAFGADRNRRSQEERDSIAATFTKATDPDAARQEVTRAIVFKLAGQK